MVPEVGDRVRIAPTKVGGAPREGVVIGATGRMLTVKWSTGEESTFVPGPGSVAVVGKVAAKSSPPAKATKKPSPATKNKGKG